MTSALPAIANDRQRSEILLEIGRARLRVAADLSPAGLLAIAALVSGVLLSTAVLVAAAGPARRAA